MLLQMAPTRLPPAYILAADLDPLRDDALHYGKKMGRAGVPVTVRNVEGGYSWIC